MREHALGWTDERVAQLKELFATAPEMSRSEMAAELGGGVTRNAVIGKLLRLGLSGGSAPRLTRVPAFRAPRAPRPPRQLKARTRIAAQHHVMTVFDCEPEPVIESDIPIGQRCTLLELNAETCRWPVGDPAQPDFFFCGGKAPEGSPYCDWHGRVAYQPLAQRRYRARPRV